MGKGVIISGGTDGQYQVQLKLHKSRIEALIVALTNQIAMLESKIETMEEGVEKEIAVLKKVALEKRKAYLQGVDVPDDPVVAAWCADLTEDLSGEVGTIEIPGERENVSIQPGHEGNAAYNAARDGQLQPAIAGTPESAFYNLALLPGWQKWKPTYRFGTITAVDGDICDVDLDAAKSSQKNMDINQATTLSNVPIEYMTCNGAAFSEGDGVIVEFEGQDWNSPKVIGFKDHPKPCGWRFHLMRMDGTLVDYSLGADFEVFNSSGTRVFLYDIAYDSETETWSFKIGGQPNPNGYWVEYSCPDGITTQYPGKYKLSDKRQAADLIKEGDYSDQIHYFKIHDAEWLPADRKRVEFSPFYGYIHYITTYNESQNTHTQRVLKIESSVQYKITERLRPDLFPKIWDWYYNAYWWEIYNAYAHPEQLEPPPEVRGRRVFLWNNMSETFIMEFHGSVFDSDPEPEYEMQEASYIVEEPSIEGIEHTVEVWSDMLEELYNEGFEDPFTYVGGEINTRFNYWEMVYFIIQLDFEAEE